MVNLASLKYRWVSSMWLLRLY